MTFNSCKLPRSGLVQSPVLLTFLEAGSLAGAKRCFSLWQEAIFCPSLGLSSGTELTVQCPLLGYQKRFNRYRLIFSIYMIQRGNMFMSGRGLSLIKINQMQLSMKDASAKTIVIVKHNASSGLDTYAVNRGFIASLGKAAHRSVTILSFQISNCQ